jgi:hypothetical protein
MLSNLCRQANYFVGEIGIAQRVDNWRRVRELNPWFEAGI